MTNSDGEECFYGASGVVRPTFLPLSLKRNTFSPTLPGTPEHGLCPSFHGLIGIADHDVTEWEMLSSSRYDVSKSCYDDATSDVFASEKGTLPREEKPAVTEPPCMDNTLTSKNKEWGSQWNSNPQEEKDNQCCSQWIRAYISKLWAKAPAEPPPENPPKPRQLTILEREFTFKQLSPKRLRRISRKRHSATSQFVYSAYIEDTVVELREERHGDVIYSITVKKDGSLPRCDSTSRSFSEVNVIKEKNTSRQVKGATLDFMVRKLSRVYVGENEDINFLNVFLTTYRTFSSPEELFTKLYDEYMSIRAESTSRNFPILRSIVRVMRAWLERYVTDDFYDDGDNVLLRRMMDFARIHDDVMNENDAVCIAKTTQRRRPVSPISPRKNGVAFGSGSFADYVAAKLAVAGRRKRGSAKSRPSSSPDCTQNPSLDVKAESATLNSSAAKQLLNPLTPRYIATQLTVIAAKLFHRVQPHHCLAKTRPQTVRATIDQFNKVVFCVIGTILSPSLKLSQRTKLLSKWIDVAQECRELKNFSSLRAIVSGLQTVAIHRLKRTWMGVPPSQTNLLKELTDINMKDLITKVGTAKVNTEDSAISSVRKEAMIRRVQDLHSGIVHGTVPYLGSFLTDLTYLDTARPDYLEGGLINFEKRRKEFELLAQLQLLQASCRTYQNLDPASEFLKWFQSITVLSEDQRFQLSMVIEPSSSSVTSPSQITSPHRKTLSEMIQGEAERSSILTSTPINKSMMTKKVENGEKNDKVSQSFNGRINSSSSTPGQQNRIVKIRLVRNKSDVLSETTTDSKSMNNVDKPIANCEYKTISISSDERRAAVIRKALELYMLDVETNLKRFSLVQVLKDSDRVIEIPDTANVYYAMSSSDHEPTLVLLEEGAEIPNNKVKRHQSTPHRPKKNRHRKNHSMSFVADSESGRSSPLFTNVASEMKSLYRQLAFGSVALVGGSSYSPSNAARRSSDSEGSEVAGADGVILLNSRSGTESGSKVKESLGKRQNKMRATMPYGGNPVGIQRSTRCHSADFPLGVVLPVRVVRPSMARTLSKDIKLSKSAPCSPHQDRKHGTQVSEDVVNDIDEITATGRLTEWSRYSATYSSTRPTTWSTRRAMRKPKKTRSTSTFYVDKKSLDVNQKQQTPDTPTSRSKFYVEITGPSTYQERDSNPAFHRSFSAATLPPRLSPDYSGYDYVERRQPFRASISLDARSIGNGLSKWDQSSLPKSSSFTSLSSDQSVPDVTGSDSGSGIHFSVISNEDVFHENRSGTKSEKENHPSANTVSSLSSLDESSGAPVIKIQCASPDNLLEDSEFFNRYGGNHGANKEIYENTEDQSTYL
ncbi:uncharacterized protein LOC120345174 isoform X1 [Styela clava]